MIYVILRSSTLDTIGILRNYGFFVVAKLVIILIIVCKLFRFCRHLWNMLSKLNLIRSKRDQTRSQA